MKVLSQLIMLLILSASSACNLPVVPVPAGSEISTDVPVTQPQPSYTSLGPATFTPTLLAATESPTSTPTGLTAEILPNTPAGTSTRLPASTPTYTPLPPLPDYEKAFTFGAPGGGVLAQGKQNCQSRFPGQVPAALGVTTASQTAFLCLWGIPLDTPFQVELVSPNAERRLKGMFYAISSTNRVAWSGHVPGEHDSRVFMVDGAPMLVIAPWWPDDLPAGTWQIHAVWPNGEVYGGLDASLKENSEPSPYLRTTDPRMANEILPSGPGELFTTHPGDGAKISGSGFQPDSIVYLLVYVSERMEMFYHPISRQFRFVEGRTVLTDNYGKFIASLPSLFKTGRLYLAVAVSDPKAKITSEGLSGPTMESDMVDALEFFYMQPAANSFDLQSTVTSCPGTAPQRMVVSQRGYVCTLGYEAQLKDGPSQSANTLFQVPPGDHRQFTVTGGPFCAESQSWWQVLMDDGSSGWIPEGNEGEPYFICPAP